MSTFDPAVLEQTVVEESNATKMDPVPEGEYSPAYIQRYNIKSVTFGDGREVPVIDLTWKIDDEDFAKKLEREEVTVRQSLFLDVSEEGVLLTGPNKNVQLGRLREALGMNKAGKAFSFTMLEGAGPCRIYVGHRKDKNDDTLVYDEVKRVVAK